MKIFLALMAVDQPANFVRPAKWLSACWAGRRWQWIIYGALAFIAAGRVLRSLRAAPSSNLLIPYEATLVQRYFAIFVWLTAGAYIYQNFTRRKTVAKAGPQLRPTRPFNEAVG